MIEMNSNIFIKRDKMWDRNLLLTMKKGTIRSRSDYHHKWKGNTGHMTLLIAKSSEVRKSNFNSNPNHL